LRICWRRQKERRMPAGRHGHKIREYKRRIDALLEAERERRRPLPPPPPPINEEHAALRRQIAELYRILFDDPEKPEGTDPIEWFEERFDERARENPELHDISGDFMDLVSKEVELLAENGVDYSPYENYELE
jgi:hypothetical protein